MSRSVPVECSKGRFPGPIPVGKSTLIDLPICLNGKIVFLKRGVKSHMPLIATIVPPKIGHTMLPHNFSHVVKAGLHKSSERFVQANSGLQHHPTTDLVLVKQVSTGL